MGHTRGPLPENRKAPPERVLFAMKCLSEMRPESALRAIMEQFKVGRSTGKRAMSHARLIMMEEEEEIRPQARAMIINRLNRVIDRAEDDKDYSAAVRGLRELVGIYGLRAPEELTVKIDPETKKKITGLTEEELRVLANMDGGDDKHEPTEH